MARTYAVLKLLTWLCAFSATMAYMDWPQKSYPDHPYDSPLGIHLGADYITVVASAKKSIKTYLVFQEEGDIRYKSLIRQKIMSHHVIRDLYEDEDPDAREPDSLEYLNSESRADVIDYLPVLYGDPASAKELKSFFTRLKEDVAVALGREFREVVVTVPAYISDATRKMLRVQIDDVGLRVLGAVRRNGLVAAQLGYDSEPERSEWHFVLFVELSGAALEVSLLTTVDRVVDVVAYEARSELGEDAATLKVIQLLAREHRLKDLNPGRMMALKSHLQRSWNSPEGEIAAPAEEFTFDTSFNDSRVDFLDLKNISILSQEQRSKNIQRTLENLLLENVWEDSSTELKPYRSEVNEILIAGDESERDMQMLRQVISESPSLSQLKMLSSRDRVPQGQTGAHAAAWNGQGRVLVEDPDENLIYIYHGEL